MTPGVRYVDFRASFLLGCDFELVGRKSKMAAAAFEDSSEELKRALSKLRKNIRRPVSVMYTL